MGFRFRKSFSLGKGTQINIGKKSTGISFGGKGARVSFSSSGRMTSSIGIPGSGLSYVNTHTIGGKPHRTKSASDEASRSAAGGAVASSLRPSAPREVWDGRLFSLICLGFAFWAWKWRVSFEGFPGVLFDVAWIACGIFGGITLIASLFPDKKTF